MPADWLVFLMAFSPIVEVRGSVPLGLFLGLPLSKILFLSILGSLLPVLPVLFGLHFFTRELRKLKIFDQFLEWLFSRTRSRSKIIEELEAVGLAIFIAIPLPGTGVWTGCVAAYLFGIPWFFTFLAAAAGTSVASLIVMGLSLGALKLW